MLSAGLMLLTACGSSTGDSGSGSGSWKYTDGSGKTVELDHTPTRIIAYAGAAAALMTYGIRPVGIYADESVETDPSLRDLDLKGIEILGEEWGVIDVEKAAELNPDLIVADWWPAEKAYSGFEEGVEEKSKKFADVAPVVGATQGSSILELVQGYEKIAASLGADVTDPKLSTDKDAFEKALARFKAATAAKPGLTALAAAPETDSFSVANPKLTPELLDFQAWGLDVINPDAPNPDFPYWENISWENADKYQPDLLLIDNRNYDGYLAEGAKHPTWKSIRAAEKGAFAEWPAYWLHTYGDYADALETLAGSIEKADANIGS